MSTLKITLFFNNINRTQKTEPYCGKSSTFPCYSVDSKSSHSPHPAFCCPLNSHASAHLASCYYTLLSPGNFPPKYLSTQTEGYSFGVMKINYLSKLLKQITTKFPCRSQQRISECLAFLLGSPGLQLALALTPSFSLLLYLKGLILKNILTAFLFLSTRFGGSGLWLVRSQLCNNSHFKVTPSPTPIKEFSLSEESNLASVPRNSTQNQLSKNILFILQSIYSMNVSTSNHCHPQIQNSAFSLKSLLIPNSW